MMQFEDYLAKNTLFGSPKNEKLLQREGHELRFVFDNKSG